MQTSLRRAGWLTLVLHPVPSLAALVTNPYKAPGRGR